MKLTTSLAEFEAGVRTRRMTVKQLCKLADQLCTQTPIQITPFRNSDGSSSNVAYVKKVEPALDGLTKVVFIPIPNRCYQVIHAATRDLNLVTIEFPWGQWSFDRSGAKQTNHKLHGPGCDPDVEPDPEFLLGSIVTKNTFHPIVAFIREHIHQKLK